MFLIIPRFCLLQEAGGGLLNPRLIVLILILLALSLFFLKRKKAILMLEACWRRMKRVVRKREPGAIEVMLSQKDRLAFEEQLKILNKIATDVNDIKSLLKRRSDRANGQQKDLKRPAQGHRPTEGAPKQTLAVSNATDVPPTDIPTDPDSVMNQLCVAYNRSLNDRGARHTFLSQFNPIRIGVSNLSARRSSDSVPPQFKTASNGYFLAVKVNYRDSQVHLVTPGFDLIVEQMEYSPGAVGYAFECDGYVRGRRHHCVKLIDPAIFELSAYDTWRLKSKGKIELSS